MPSKDFLPPPPFFNKVSAQLQIFIQLSHDFWYLSGIVEVNERLVPLLFHATLILFS